MGKVWTIVRAFISPWRAAFQAGKDSMDWMDLPSGHFPASGLPGAVLTPQVMVFARDTAAVDVLSDCRDAPMNRAGWHVAKVWLRADQDALTAEVMVGVSRVGWTQVSSEQWTSMVEMAREDVFIDGSLEVGDGVGDSQPVGLLTCAFAGAVEGGGAG